MEKNVTISNMAIRPRLVVDVDHEFLAQIRVVAAKNRTSVRKAVIEAIAKEYPEMKKVADKELDR